MQPPHPTTRRHTLTLLASSLLLPRHQTRADEVIAPKVCDIHQHTHYHGRTDEHLISHQRAMGIHRSILLPAGTPMQTASTHDGKSNGLAAQCGTTAEAQRLAAEHPDLFLWGVNDVTDAPEAPKVIETYLKQGACIIGEQKFDVACDSAASQRLYAMAADYGVPILLHFQNEMYNRGYETFHRMLEKYPRTTFIGHAQAVWGYIDANHDRTQNYPKGPVTRGGLTDRYLTDYANMFADLSAGSGLNALMRDEEHTRGFLTRHQDKLLYGSDCKDHFGRGPGCQGAQTLAAIRQLAPDPAAIEKILWKNAARLFPLEAKA